MSEFSENYFDDGIPASGKYKSYEFNRFEKPFNVLSSNVIENLNPELLLDIGCAKGFLVSIFKKKGIEVHGVDISEYAINESAEDIKPYLSKVDLNFDKLPFEDSSFDTIICMGTLEYVKDQDFLINEIKRVLKKNGTILITTLNKIPSDDILRIYYKEQKHWDRLFKANNFASSHDKARTIFRGYIVELNKYELFKKNSLKKKIASFLYKNGFSLFIDYMFFKLQLSSGYTILGYQKKGD